MWHHKKPGPALVALLFMTVLACPAAAGDEVLRVSESGEPVRSDPVVKVAPLLQQIIETGIGQDTCNGGLEGRVEVNILLTTQGGDAIGRQVRALQADRVAGIKKEIIEIRCKGFPEDVSLSPEEERSFARWNDRQLPEADQQRVVELKQELEALGVAMDNEITRQLRQAFTPSQDDLCAFIEAIGGKVNSRLTAINAITATVPVEAVHLLAEHPLVLTIGANRTGEPELDNQFTSTGADAFHNDSPAIDGDPWDIASIDGGVDETHPAISSHTFIDNYASQDYHGTGTVGMYASTDPTFQGLASGLDKIFVDHAGCENNTMDGFDWVLTYSGDNAEVFNYSWGCGIANDEDYNNFDRFFDGVISTYDCLVSKSTGNEYYGVTTITHPAPAFNLIASANMWDNDTVTRTDDLITDSSSTGPTLDGRRKPDITAPGTNTWTCDVGGGWQNLGGTSSAAPKTGSGALLLQDYGIGEVMAQKAVLINTADAWTSNNTETTADDGPVDGDHWDPRFGWGYLDLDEAWFNAGDHFIDNVTARNTADDYDLYAGWLDQHEKVTAVWQRRVGYQGDAYPTLWYDLTDINLRLYDQFSGGTYEDHDFDADDNVHQVSAQSSGIKVAKVYCWSSAIDGAVSEDYALATEEIWIKVEGPDFSSFALSCPAYVSCAETFTVVGQVSNTGDIHGHDLDVTLELPAGYTLVSGSNPQAVGTVPLSSTGEASWTVQAPSDATGTFTLGGSFTSFSYGEAQNGTTSFIQEVNPHPAHDLCSGAIVIPGAYGSYAYNDHNLTACNDYDAGAGNPCTGYAAQGRDVVYAVTLSAPSEICVTLLPDTSLDAAVYLTPSCTDPGSSCLGGSDAIGYGATENFCVTVGPTGPTTYYIICDGYGELVGGQFALEVTTSPLGQTISASLDASPSSGQLPFSSVFTAGIGNNTANIRRAAAHIDVSLANGAFYPNWRAGFTNIAGGDTFVATWGQNFPGLPTLVGTNVFTLLAEDVTPSPYNQPPYAPAGDTASDSCTVTAAQP